VSNPAAPSPRAIIDFRAYRDDNGTGIALDGNYVYLTAERGLGTDNGVNGDTRLYIGQYASLQDNGGIPPQVTLTSPPNHSSVIRGAQLSLRANASDDVAVSVVTFSVDGMDVGTDSVEPYQAQYRVPPNATTLEVGARAVDPAGNVGVANPVRVTAVDDPLTTATGLVVDASTAVVAGAAVDCLGLTGASMSDGSFSVVGIPTVLGSIFCSATATNGDIRLIGASARYPAVLAGVTDVGTIILGAQKLQSRISGGYDHTCALTSAGWLKCWGDGRDGQLGDGSLNSSATPRDVAGLTSGVLAVAAGWHHSCALTSAGGLKCWGDGHDGQLGDGNVNGSATPRDVAGLTSGVLAVTAGTYHNCALTSAGGLKCWGFGEYGQLGGGSFNSSAMPRDVAGFSSGVVAVAAGTYHSCALTSAGGLKCWGDSINGQVGDGSFNISATPTEVAGLSSGVVAVAAGYSHTCALTSAGGLKCWGYNAYGQLGDGSFNGSATPRDVTGLSSGVVAIAAGGNHSCALTSAGGLKCWGYNFFGQLGDGSFNRSATPRDVAGLSSGLVAVAAGGNHTCALTSAGGVKCWGFGESGQLGDGSFNSSAMPKDVIGF
jgi:alpha-tubulin suppressor-like RCC1 family protein